VSAVLTAQEPSAKYLVNLQPPLVRHFDLIAQAPGGVARLRELILTLSVQGKLVPQDPSDEPASELLKKIRDEKDRLIAEGKIKRDKPFAEIADEEKSFELPAGWEWVRLGELVNLTYGKNLPTSSLTDDGFQVFGANGVIGRYSQYLYEDEQLLISCRGAYSGKPNVSPQKCFVTNNSIVCEFFVRSMVDLGFFYRQLQITDKSRLVTGSAQPQVTIANADPLILVVPPLAEQSRIVTRVEELMQLCDALEASGQLEAQQHAQLVNTLLGTLTQSETPEALADNWQRIATHFDVLLDRPEAVDALEQTILQLAVRGLLVPQDPTDEPASVLLQKIRTEKDQFIAQGKIKRDKPLPPITDEEKPFELPHGWEWVRLGSAAKKITDGTHHSPANFPTGDYLYLSAKNIKPWGIDLSSATYVPKHIHDEIYARCDPELGDVLYIKDGATTGILTINTLSQPFSLLSSVGVIKPSCGLTAEFMALVMQSPFFYQAVRDDMSGVAITRVTLSKLGAAKFPLPPLAEQARIITRVNELRSLCADLRQRLAALQSGQKQLAQALIENASS
jgi:type I restriction enzyme S subunit